MAQNDWSWVDSIIRTVLAEHDGVAKMSMFVAAGLKNKQVAAALGRGVLDRPRDAWYVDPDLPWQGKHAVRTGGVLTCVSATESFGLPVPPGSHLKLHVLVPENSARVRDHRNKHHYVVPGEDRDVKTHWVRNGRRYRGWRTPLVDTLISLEHCVDEAWWIAALDAARRCPRDGSPLLSDDGWADLCARVPRRLRRALRLVDPRCESPIETVLRLGLIRRGIGPFLLQYSPDERRRVDFLLGARLIVEADGVAYHDPEADAIRDAAFRSLGYIVLRFSYERIVFDLEAVLDEIAEALATLEGAF